MTRTNNHSNIYKTMSSTCEGRLTLESGVAVSTTDQTAKTTVYFTPYRGTNISVYDGSDWNIFTFSELSLSISSYTADTNFDIFIYDNSGTLTLESVAWTDDTTRATALTTQDGVYVKSGATTRRYLGTIRTTSSTGQCEDSEDRRFVWSYYNQVKKHQQARVSSPLHTYATQAYRPFKNSTVVGETRYEFVVGLDTYATTKHNLHSRYMYGAATFDSTTSSFMLAGHNGDATNYPNISMYVEGSKYLSDGFHFAQALEFGINSSSGGFESELTGDHLC